jgi:hypothetical protein
VFLVLMFKSLNCLQGSWFFSLTGLDNHQFTDLPICRAGAASGYSNKGPAASGYSNKGPVMFITTHQYASIGHDKTIDSSLQLDDFGLNWQMMKSVTTGTSSSLFTIVVSKFPKYILYMFRHTL